MRRKMTRREDYLKLIYTLSREGEVHGADLADELDVKRPTVCVYLKRLVNIGDIVMDFPFPGQGVDQLQIVFSARHFPSHRFTPKNQLAAANCLL